jgi:hypothetical protein
LTATAKPLIQTFLPLFSRTTTLTQLEVYFEMMYCLRYVPYLPHEIQLNKVYLIDRTCGYLWKASPCIEALRRSVEHPLSKE